MSIAVQYPMCHCFTFLWRKVTSHLEGKLELCVYWEVGGVGRVYMLTHSYIAQGSYLDVLQSSLRDRQNRAHFLLLLFLFVWLVFSEELKWDSCQ